MVIISSKRYSFLHWMYWQCISNLRTLYAEERKGIYLYIKSQLSQKVALERNEKFAY